MICNNSPCNSRKRYDPHINLKQTVNQIPTENRQRNICVEIPVIVDDLNGDPRTSLNYTDSTGKLFVVQEFSSK
jgi:hypothetical protein